MLIFTVLQIGLEQQLTQLSICFFLNLDLTGKTMFIKNKYSLRTISRYFQLPTVFALLAAGAVIQLVRRCLVGKMKMCSTRCIRTKSNRYKLIQFIHKSFKFKCTKPSNCCSFCLGCMWPPLSHFECHRRQAPLTGGLFFSVPAGFQKISCSRVET